MLHIIQNITHFCANLPAYFMGASYSRYYKINTSSNLKLGFTPIMFNLIFIIITAFSVGGCLFNTFTGNYLNVWIYNIIQLPLQALANTTGGILVLALVNQLFWFLGIHGGMVIEGVRGPLSAAGLAENISAVQAGGVATNILTRGFWTSFVVVGGGGIYSIIINSNFHFFKT